VIRPLCVAFGLVLFVGHASAAEIHVVSSGGFAAAYKQLAPEFEKQTGNTLDSAWGPSMGDTHDAVPQRLARGEPIDVVIMVSYALDQLAQQGAVIADSRRELARSIIGIAVRAGAPKPDVSTPDALKDTLLKAKSIAYSDSASGVYVQNVLLKKLGIAEEVRGKTHMIPAEPVGQVVARGGAEIGFQQISELKPVKGIDIIGPLPDSLQQVTIFSAGIPVGAKQPEAAKQLIDFLASPAAADAIRDSGMEPIATERR
jgi:molybdate transport system substrate-binding protein